MYNIFTLQSEKNGLGDNMNIKNNNNPFIKELTEKYNCEVFNWLVMENQICSKYVEIDKFRDEPSKEKIFIPYKKEVFLQNPYIKNIKISKVVGDKFILSRGRILPSKCIEKYDETRFNLDTLSFNHQFYYCEDYLHFPTIYQKNDDSCWMSVEPFEINSFDKIYHAAHGKVLLLGLGLGYLPYMLSQKDNVSKITIVEIDDEIIRIFKENILSQFENKDKIEVVEASGIDFLKSYNLNTYDYINIDIWKSILDMLPYYLQILGIEKQYPNVQFSYWLESELKCELQRAIISAVIQQPMNSDFDKLAKTLVKKKTNYTRNNFTKLIELKNFRDIMYKLYLEYKDTYDYAVDTLTSQYVKKPSKN